MADPSDILTAALMSKYGPAKLAPQMNLSPQEEYLYQMHLNNLMGPGGITNFNGSRSTLRQMDAEVNGRTYNLPTVWNGQVLPPDQALAQSKATGLGNFPSYSDPMVAQDRYSQMHQMLDEDVQRAKTLPMPLGSWPSYSGG